jgi:MFS family permease
MSVFHGWYVVACAFLIAVWGWGLGFYGLGIYLVGLRDAHGWSTAFISSAITVYYLIGAGLVSLLGAAMRRVGIVPTVVTGLLAMAASVVAVTIVTRPWHLYAALALMAVGWSAMSGATVNLLIAPWFERRRGLAISLAFTGASAGGVLVAPLMLWLIGRFGFAGGVRLAAAVMLAVLLPAVLVVLRRTPEQLGVGPDGVALAPRGRGVVETEPEGPAGHGPARRPAAGAPPGGGGPSPDAPGRPVRAAMRSLPYWTISIPFALGLAAQVGFLTHQVAYLSPLIGLDLAGLAVGLTGLAAIAGRFALGAVIDRVNVRRAACANFLLQVGALGLLVWAPAPAAILAGCVAFGLGVGNMVSLPGLLLHREFPTALFAALVSLVTATNQLTFAFAPVLIGVLRDATGSYVGALVLCMMLDLLAAAVVLVRRVRAGRDRVATASERARRSTPDGGAMLQLRPNCECCDADLPPASREAYICSFECTFCRRCAEEVLSGRCPNCGGELVRRPVRPADKLAKFPPSGPRVLKPEGCEPAAARR